MTIDARKQRGLALVKSKGSRIREVVEGRYLVPSQTRTSGSYFVDAAEGVCSCPDHEEHGLRCKHIYAVLYLRRELAMPVGADESAVVPKKKTYPQNWTPYRKSRMNEKFAFERLLAALCRGVVQPEYAGNGRPALPRADVIFASALKVYTLFAQDRSHSDLRACKDRGLIDTIPSPNTVLRVMRHPKTTLILRSLIDESTRPLRQIEHDFAADATGIGTRQYVRWFDKKWGKDKRERKWLKLHVMVGVKTQIITAAEVTASHGEGSADVKQLPALVEATANRFEMLNASFDKGYLGHDQYKAVAATGATPWIPFKPNSRGDTKDPLWNKMHAIFTLNQEEWKAHYHKRSLSETTFSTIKRVLGATTKAKSNEGAVNEIYAKVLAHNIRMLVQAIFELQIDPKFWGGEAETPDAAE